MSDDPQQIERDSAINIYAPDPVLGKYVSHHPSNRTRLVIIGSLIYGIPVGLLQFIFWNQDTTLVNIFLPMTFALIAMGVLWWVLHHWNREVVLYEQGFSYRQGSAVAYIQYTHVIKLMANLERVSFLGLSRKVFDYRLITDIDEQLIINNVYSNPDKLTHALEVYVARARLPIIQRKLATGETISFGESLHVTPDGITLQEQMLTWERFKGQSVKDGQLIIQATDEAVWQTLDVSEIDNPALLIMFLRDRGQVVRQSS